MPTGTDPTEPENTHGCVPITLEERVAKELGLETHVSVEFLRVAFENARLFDKKQQDYGPKNISGFGTFGVVVRMNDKFERLKTLFGKRRRRPQNETIRDSFKDICNYAIIAELVETKRWPES